MPKKKRSAVEATTDISAVPRKEFCIELIERLGVKAIYPNSTETAEAAIARINATPDTKWYPPDDVYWNDHEKPSV